MINFFWPINTSASENKEGRRRIEKRERRREKKRRKERRKKRERF